MCSLSSLHIYTISRFPIVYFRHTGWVEEICNLSISVRSTTVQSTNANTYTPGNVVVVVLYVILFYEYHNTTSHVIYSICIILFNYVFLCISGSLASARSAL